MKRFKTGLALAVAAPLLLGATGNPRELGKKEGACRPGDPSLLVQVIGLKDRTGTLKLEVYPPTDPEFLMDDAKLVASGKTFRRVEVPVPAGAPPELCIRIPGPGTYSVVLLHDRNRDHKFQWINEGIGFASNPKMGMSQPKSAAARVSAGPGATRLPIVMNYFRGMGLRPLAR